MKLRSLFLASLAAMAMVSCSNDVEGVDNGGAPEGEKALMQIGFAFPAATRADKPAASIEELKVKDVTVVLEYGATRKREVVTGTASNENQTIVTNEFEVTAGVDVNIYAFLNASDALKKSLENAPLKEIKETANGTKLDYIIGKDGIAEDNAFLMSNVDGKAEVATLKALEKNKVTISVERTSAKIEEATATTEYTIAQPTQKGQFSDMKIKLVDHTFINLAKNTYVLDQNKNTDDVTFLQPYASASYDWKASVGGNEVTYCMENYDATGIAGKSTCVLYKAEVSYGGQAAATFYVWNNTIYLTYAELKAAYATLPDVAPNQKELKETYYVDMYVDGVCYYIQPITTGATKEIKVVRNNWYKLDVTNITKLGYPTPIIPAADPTMLILTINIVDWTVNLNEIEF